MLCFLSLKSNDLHWGSWKESQIHLFCYLDYASYFVFALIFFKKNVWSWCLSYTPPLNWLQPEPLLLLPPSAGSEGETCYYLWERFLMLVKRQPLPSAICPACPRLHLLLLLSLSDSHPLVCFGSGAREVSLLLLYQKSALLTCCCLCWLRHGRVNFSLFRFRNVVEVTGRGLEKADILLYGPEDVMAYGSYYLLWSSQSV